MHQGTDTCSLMTRSTGSQSTAALMDVVKRLKQDLAASREESKQADDQIACLITLVKRAWNGDKSASVHLSNIVGPPVPNNFVGHSGSHANSQVSDGHYDDNAYKTLAVQHWERLSLKLLEREYSRIEREIKKRQSMHMQHRELYLEELLHSHEEDMARVPLHRRTSSHNPSLEQVDKDFIQQHGRLNSANRVNSAARLRQRRQLPKGPREVVKQANVQVVDFFIHNSQSDSTINVNKGMNELYQYSKGSPSQEERRNSVPAYDDPSRYAQPQLFDVKQAFCQPWKRKPRPVSAAMLRNKDQVRARPKSAVFVTQTVERPLKYETTRPVSGKARENNKPPVPRLRLEEANQRHVDKDEAHTIVRQPAWDGFTSNHTHLSPVSTNGDYAQGDISYKPSITVRIRSATKRPECIDKFETDLQNMNNMEEEFRRTTLQLQKKLGINGEALIY